MAEDGLRSVGFSSGLALVLNGDDKKENSQKNRLISNCDDFGDQSLEQTLEHIFDLPCKTINLRSFPIDVSVVRSIIKNDFLKYHGTVEMYREGVSSVGDGPGSHIVTLDESSIYGDVRVIKAPLHLESHAAFGSARANACVWKGKWMYEVTLETSGVQQIGWVTLSCPFTGHTGVGDDDDSYAFDGKRVIKWNGTAETYGQPWVVGDVIGCCIDFDVDEISFYRNGSSLGVAFRGIHKMVPGLGYHPALSISLRERCELNFGAHEFRYPIQGFLPIQAPPPVSLYATRLLHCLSKLLEIQRRERANFDSIRKMGRLKRFLPFDELFYPVSRGICEELFSALDADPGSAEYVGRGPLLSFLMEVFREHAPHDYKTLDRVLDRFLEFPGSRLLFEHLIDALPYCCTTASIVLSECPYSGAYPYLALACHMFRREELMVIWWKKPDFEILFEGFLFQKTPNKHDLQCMMPSVWWPGSCEDTSYESSMMLTTRALSDAVNKIEEKHRELCSLVMQFIPPITPLQSPGAVFRMFLQNLLLKNRGADRNVPPDGLSSNSVLVSLFNVLLHFLSEGFAMGGIHNWIKGSETNTGTEVGFLHRGGQQSFPISLFLKSDPHRVGISRLGGTYSHLVKYHPVNFEQETEIIMWDEGCMDDEETRVTHLSRQMPCCCSSYDAEFSRISKIPLRNRTKDSQGHCSSLPERSAQVSAEYSSGNLNDEMSDKPSTSDHRSQSEYDYRPIQQVRTVAVKTNFSSATLKEEELLDAMLLLYHLGLAPNFKQASHFLSHQSQSISLLEETDRQIKDGANGEPLRRLKESRGVYREEVIECVRYCSWYRISLFSRWKQRGMYAACMWIAQLLLVLSNMDSVFSYVPEYYIQTLVDSFHVLRKSDPQFVPPGIFIRRGLTSFVTFIATHFNDPRISSAELRDLLLQSISVLVQYKEFLAAFEVNQAAAKSMPRALLSAFDKRACQEAEAKEEHRVKTEDNAEEQGKGIEIELSENRKFSNDLVISISNFSNFSNICNISFCIFNRAWIPVTNILLRLCRSSRFGSSKHGESSTSSVTFQNLLRDACTQDEELFSAFLNSLFNTLSWAMTEFSVSIRELEENFKLMEYQKRKCGIIFDLSCNLTRILEFCTCEVPLAFLSGSDTNLRRLIEVFVFMLNQLTSVENPEIFDLTFRRPGQSPEKVNRSMILAPLAGIILNLLDARLETDCGRHNDIVGVFASMDCPNTVLSGFQYLLEFNWCGYFTGDAHLMKLKQLKEFSHLLVCQLELQPVIRPSSEGEVENDDFMCCICYATESDTKFVPCSHVSCFGCISRHLLNCDRCFFCNSIVSEVIQNEMSTC